MLLQKKIQNKVFRIKNRVIKNAKIARLKKLSFNDSFVFKKIWPCEIVDINLQDSLNESFQIFGVNIDLSNVDWHKDYVSNFTYPLKRFDTIKIAKFFDKGIDVKFPWELSRFYFGPKLAQQYLISRDEKYYFRFRNLVTEWISRNPFLIGINWYCTMEVAIRAINWIVSTNLFGDIFTTDKEFSSELKRSLLQHAEYISSFPEFYPSGRTNNHTTADYAGLLFLALALHEYKKSCEWRKQAIDGLILCMESQVYDDGVNFEGSISYHRLVLELFGYCAILCRTNEVDLPLWYYTKLFKMFEYVAAYIDHSGNAPQVGDNDSGRVLVLHKSDEHNHSYLLDLGESIFDYRFKSQCFKRNPGFKCWLPEFPKVSIDELDVIPRKTDESIAIDYSGAYLLKNSNYSIFFSNLPVAKNGTGGHHHFDNGSFALSYQGQPVVVDSGTFTYTRSKAQRDLYRDRGAHNICLPLNSGNGVFSKYNYWELNDFDVILIDAFKKDDLAFKNRTRSISVFFNLRNDKLCVNLRSWLGQGVFFLLHLSPDFKPVEQRTGSIYGDINGVHVEISSENGVIESKAYHYSTMYGCAVSAPLFKIIQEDPSRDLEIFLNCNGF